MFIIIAFLTNNIYAKYNYVFYLEAYSLTRDTSDITYELIKTCQDGEYTNQDVNLKISCNKQIEEVEGFSLDESKKILTKTVSENESKSIILEDFSGNTKEVKYEINSIDKEPPEIIGIDDGVTYNKSINVEYLDNIGVKDIKVDKYGDKLQIYCQEHYYDSGFLKGTYVTSNKIYIDVTEHPKGTKYYKFYLNNNLKGITEKSEYTFTGLKTATTYNVLVQAINENDEIIDSITRTIKTKCFSSISSRKEGDNFYVTISGIDSRVNIGYLCLWNQNSSVQKVSYPQMNSDRSINLSFNAYDVDGKKCNGYYYFHLQLFNSDSNSNYNEVVVMNVMFDGKTYVKLDDDNIDPYELSQNGNYDITVTDLAGNITNKKCIIKK